MNQNSRQLAKTWPYIRHKNFEASLRNAARKWFAVRGCATHPRMDYCLARHDLWPQNIICPNVAEFIQAEQRRHLGKDSFPLHKYLHHGLSSQAMAFNLIGPLVVRKDLEPLRQCITRIGLEWPEGDIQAGFEQDERNVFHEDAGQPTSIDVTLTGKTGNVFMEVKLVEREFGGCSVFAGGDCEGRNPYPDRLSDCYLHHIGRLYWQRMQEHGFSYSPLITGAICPFANHYQFFREVLFAFAKGGKFILLHDERNPAFYRTSEDGAIQRGLWPFLIGSIPSALRHNVGRLTVQGVVQAVVESGRHEDWIHDFRDKYRLK